MHTEAGKFRYSLKTLLFMWSVAGVLLFIVKTYMQYHTSPREVNVGYYSVVSSKDREAYLCECEVVLTTNWPDVLEHRVQARRELLDRQIALAIQSVSWNELCDPALAILKAEIELRVSSALGGATGRFLVNGVILCKYSATQKSTAPPPTRTKR
ncbi:MAG: hypothetical protein KDA61_14355 [Planctomycetales bacterium]|nr:hypothetical protein [Planctomycetales bacterium]